MNYEIDGEYRGKNKEELGIIATQIRAGKPYKFDVDEVRDIVEYAHKVLSIPLGKLVIDGLKWLVPPLIVLTLIYVLIFLRNRY